MSKKSRKEVYLDLAKDENSFVLLGNGDYKGPLQKGSIENQKIHIDKALKQKKHRVGAFLKKGIIKIDIDDIHGINDYIKANLPETLTIRTKRGYHLFFTVTNPKKYKKGTYILRNQILAEIIPAFDKGYAILDYNDDKRKFIKSQCGIAELPNEWDIQKRARKREIDGQFEKVLPIKEGSRDTDIYNIACVLKDRFDNPSLLHSINKYCVNPPLDKKVIEDKWNAVKQLETNMVSDIETDEFVTENGKLMHKKVALYIENNYDILIVAEAKAKMVAIYKENHWKIHAYDELLDIVEECLPFTMITVANKKAIADLVIQSSKIRRRWTDFNINNSYIPFEKRMFDYRLQKFIPHHPSHMNTYVLPHDINENTEYVKPKESFFYKSFLSQTSFTDDDIRMVLDWMGYCLLPTAHLKTFVFLNGPTNTGKSVLINSIRHLIGSDNLSDISMHELSDNSNRFITSEFLNKLVNSDGDGSAKALKDISVIKKLTGNDRMKHEGKGEKPWYYFPFAKHMFSFNRLPMQVDEKSDAFYGRLRIFSMTKKVTYDDQFVKHELVPSVAELLPYLIQKSIPKIQVKNIYNSPKSLVAIKNLYESSDSTQYFINNNLMVSKDAYIKKDNLYESYAELCTDEDVRPVKKTEFYTSLEEKGFKVIRKRMPDGSRAYVYKDIKIKGYDE